MDAAEVVEAWPRVEIGRWPTPLRRLDQASQLLGAEVWLKSERDAGAWGATKVRKLEYYLAEAEGGGVPAIATVGAGTSSWAAATALHGRERGFDVTLGLAGAIPDDYRQLYRGLGTKIVPLPWVWLLPLSSLQVQLRRHALALPAGGSGGIGDIGAVRAGLEFAVQVAEAGLDRPHAVYVAAGTCGTAAGLAVGLALGGLTCPVLAVRVTPRPYGTLALVRRRIAQLRALLGFDRFVPVPVIGRAEFFRPGYGRSNPASTEAIEIAHRDGVELDSTYAAKAFAALIADSRRRPAGPVLFLDTSPGPSPQEDLLQDG